MNTIKLHLTVIGYRLYDWITQFTRRDEFIRNVWIEGLDSDGEYEETDITGDFIQNQHNFDATGIKRLGIRFAHGNAMYIVYYMGGGIISFPPYPLDDNIMRPKLMKATIQATTSLPDLDVTEEARLHAGPRCDFYANTDAVSDPSVLLFPYTPDANYNQLRVQNSFLQIKTFLL